MPQKRWARARQTGAHGLRRGAWYLLVNDPGGSLIILNVRKHNIPVPRTMVVVSDDSPERWSVVRWDEYQLGVQTASQKGTGLTLSIKYGECLVMVQRRGIAAQTLQ